MTDAQPALRTWSQLSENEQGIIKLLYVNGVHSLAQLARTWNINFNGLNQRCYQDGWKKEKEEAGVSLQHNMLAHQKFGTRVHSMMEAIHQGYEDLMMRHQLADTFEQFPFEAYFSFLEVYAKTANSLGSVRPVSQEVTNLYLQQNNLQQNLTMGGDGSDDGEVVGSNPAFANITDKNAKVMLRKVVENIVLQARPPAPKEVQATLAQPQNEPDPARGKYR